MTIVDAIKEVLLTEGHPMTYREIYKKIIAKSLYSFGTKTPEAIVNNKVRKHCYGLDFPSASPIKHFTIVPSKDKSTRYYLYTNVDKDSRTEESSKDKSDSLAKDTLPEERLHNEYIQHRKSLKLQLLDEILASDPAFFERLVVDLLLAMGYGGNGLDSGVVRGGPGDGGIDGVIKEDKLGLDKIYIQAKRYRDCKIGRPDLQRFVGAMENVNKGVFITTSDFARTAHDYIEKQQKSIILIDGDKLCDLMIDHDVGVSIVRNYSTFKVDNDYFSD